MGFFRRHFVSLVVIGVLVLVFGIKLDVRSLFFAPDRLILYQSTIEPGRCIDAAEMTDPRARRFKRYSQAEEWSYAKLTSRYSGRDIETVLAAVRSARLCPHVYATIMGHVGTEPVAEVELRMDRALLRGLVHVEVDRNLQVRVRDLNASAPRDGDPGILREVRDGEVVIGLRDIAPGTLVRIYFDGWIGPGRVPPAWDQLGLSVEAGGEATLRRGDPRATALGRSLDVLGKIFR